MVDAKRKILVTGGLGFVGSHCEVECLSEGWDVVCFDNLSNSCIEVKKRIEAIAGREIVLEIGCCTKMEDLRSCFEKYGPFDAVIHAAGMKSPTESIQKPMLYYKHDFVAVLNVLEVMKENGSRRLIFSSSACVYAPAAKLMEMRAYNNCRVNQPKPHPNARYKLLTEKCPLSPINPYGRAKHFAEQLIMDECNSTVPTLESGAFEDAMCGISLRYFNPIGAHSSGLIGESPMGTVPANVLPVIQRVATGKLAELTICGADYMTYDGTGVRDYIDIVDLAKGHVMAVKRMFDFLEGSYEVFNLGTGLGTSVRDLVSKYEEATGVTIATKDGPRRHGDVPEAVALPVNAGDGLNWFSKTPILKSLRNAHRFQLMNNSGYTDSIPERITLPTEAATDTEETSD